ncbi:unnamed protein product [Calypogeia fissa]
MADAAVVGRQWNGLSLFVAHRCRSRPSRFGSFSPFNSRSRRSNGQLVMAVGQANLVSPKLVTPVVQKVKKSVTPVGGGKPTTATTTTVGQAKFISMKSVSPVVQKLKKSVSPAGGATKVKPATTTAAAAVVVVASSQQSSAKIKRSNRRSRFGEPLSTTDCDDDDELCDALSTDVHLLEMGFLEEELGSRKSHRKGKRITRAGAKRVTGMASSHVITQVPKGGKNQAIKQQGKGDGLNGTQIKSGPMGIKLKPARARGSVEGTKLRNFGDMFLSDAAWEEHAYQIIRQQKLRNAALAETATERMTGQPKKAPAKTPTNETVLKITTTASLKHGTPSPVDAGSKEDGEVSSMSKRLGLDDKCEALLVYLHSLGVRDREFIRIVDKHKTCLQANVNVVKERVQFLLSVGVQFQHLPKLIVRHPQILEYRVEQAMKPRVQYLKSLGLDESKIGKIITVAPSLLECSLERSIKPRISYLVKNMGIKSEDIGKIVMRSPQILTQSIEDSLEPRLDFYVNELKLSKEALAKMVTRHPQLLHYSVGDGVRPRVKYLRSLGMSDDDVIKVLSRLTQILSLSVENCLQPKYSYLVKELNGGVHTVTSFPAYFSLSLDQRIIPRHRYSEFLERTPDGPFPMRLLTISDMAFCHWAKSSMEAYDKFRHDLLLSTFATKFERKNKVLI